jgi:hypothetical protein
VDKPILLFNMCIAGFSVFVVLYVYKPHFTLLVFDMFTKHLFRFGCFICVLTAFFVLGVLHVYKPPFSFWIFICV